MCVCVPCVCVWSVPVWDDKMTALISPSPPMNRHSWPWCVCVCVLYYTCAICMKCEWRSLEWWNWGSVFTNVWFKTTSTKHYGALIHFCINFMDQKSLKNKHVSSKNLGLEILQKKVQTFLCFICIWPVSCCVFRRFHPSDSALINLHIVLPPILL